MGNKTHPRGLRLGYTADWESKWFSLREMPALIGEDFKIRNLVKKTFRMAAVSWVGIERAGSYLRVNIHTARPGVVIGKRGADIEAIRGKVETLTQRKTFVNVMEIKDPELDAAAGGRGHRHPAREAHRLPPRHAARPSSAPCSPAPWASRSWSAAASTAPRSRGASGPARAACPCTPISADVDYGTAEAYTTAGIIGVKVWIFKKLHFVKGAKEFQQMAKAAESAAAAAALAIESGGTPAAPRRSGGRRWPRPRREGGTPHADA